MGDVILKGDFMVIPCMCKDKKLVLRSIEVNGIEGRRLGKVIDIDYLKFLGIVVKNNFRNIMVNMSWEDKKVMLNVERIFAKDKRISFSCKWISLDLPKMLNGVKMKFYVGDNSLFGNKNSGNNPFLYTNVESGYSAKSFPQKIIEINPWGRMQTSPMVGVAKLPNQ